MASLGWVLFVLAVLWFFGSQRLNHRKRISLESYAVYLLLADDIRNRHKGAFHEWIKQCPADNAMTLSTLAHNAIDRMAEGLAVGDPSNPGTSSTLGAHAMLWQTKKALS